MTMYFVSLILCVFTMKIKNINGTNPTIKEDESYFNQYLTKEGEYEDIFGNEVDDGEIEDEQDELTHFEKEINN